MDSKTHYNQQQCHCKLHYMVQLYQMHLIYSIYYLLYLFLTIYEFDFNLDMALVLGSEEKGVRALVQKKCDFLVSVPMQGTLDSLNASVAGAVVMFEAMRQQRFTQ